MDIISPLFFEPLSYPFMQNALLMATLISLVCSIFSCFLVLKGWSLMGDALSHAVLPGITLAYVAAIPLSIGAFISALFCTLLIGFIKAHSRIKEDAVMGIIFSGMFAVGLVLMTKIESDVHLMHILFGNLLGIVQSDMFEAIVISFICIAVMLLKRKDFMLFCFDPAQARVQGLNVNRLHIMLLILLALTIVAAIKAVGIILVIAMLIAPGAIGFLLARSFGWMLICAICVSFISCIIGVFASFHLDVATAPLIVLIQSSVFMLAILKTKIVDRKVVAQRGGALCQ